MTASRPLLLLALTTLALGLPVVTFAQSTSTKPAARAATVLATVNIQNAKLISQAGNTLHLAFDLTNRGGFQTGVRYAVDLIATTTKGQFLADEQVYPATLSLAENSSTHEDITYTVPSALSGTFTVLITIRKDSGLSLGVTPVGTVTLASTEGIELIPSSCYLSVLGEKGSPHYTLAQGVDIASDELLRVTCTAQNHGSASVSAIPSFETHYRTNFGEVVAQTGGAATPISFSANEKKIIDFTLPKAEAPQAYDVSLKLHSGAATSNTIIAHYVLRGASATIQTLLLDKNQYETGDTAALRMFWSPSADGFSGSRAGTSTPSAVSFTASLAGGGGESCSAPVSGLLAYAMQDATFSITRGCVDPHVTVALLDARGAVLAQKTVSIMSDFHSHRATSQLVLIGLGILLALLVGAYVSRKRHYTGTPIAPTLLLLLVGITVLVPTHSAKADVYLLASGCCDDGGYGYVYNFDASLDNNTYAPGAPINVSVSVYLAEGGSTWDAVNGYNMYISASTYVNSNHDPKQLFATAAKLDESSHGGSATLTAPTAPGSYEVDIFVYGNDQYWTTYSLPFTVVAPPPVWTTYCTGGNNSNPAYNWQWWQYDNSTPTNYQFLRAGDGTCVPTWTTYCTGGNNSNPAYNWQWWQYDNSTPTNYQFLRAGDGTCVAPIPIGYFDSATCTSIDGWAYDPKSPSTSIPVHLYKDGAYFNSYMTDQFRSDVNGAYSISGNHGFSISTPSSFKDGAIHSLSVYAINTNGSGPNPLISNSPQSITCAAPIWTTYCTGGSDPNGNNWQWWQYDNSTPTNYQFLRAGDGTCVAPSLPPVSSINAVCNAAGTQATISWPTVSGATVYYPRVSTPLGTCPAGWTMWTDGTTCYVNSYSGTSITFNTTPGSSTYNTWVYPGEPVNWNNPPSTTFTCPVPALPDLTAGAVSPISATVNTATTLSALISNANTPTGAAFTDLFEINPTSIPADFASIQSLRTFASGALAAGGSNTASASYTFPSAGTWYVRACADTNASNVGTIAESNASGTGETNNCGPWTAVSVTGAGGGLSCTLAASGSGADLTLTWTSASAVSASIDHSVGAATPVASGSKTVTGGYPSANTTYVMTVTGSGGATATCSSNLVVGGGSCTSGCSSCTTSCCGISCSAANNPSCSPATQTIASGATATWTASGGSGSGYKWYDGATNALLGSGSGYSHAYNADGSVYVKDSVNAQSSTCSVIVSGGACGTASATIAANPTRLPGASGTTHVSWSASNVNTTCKITANGAPVHTTATAVSCGIGSDTSLTPDPTISEQTKYCISCDGATKGQAGYACAVVDIGSSIIQF